MIQERYQNLQEKLSQERLLKTEMIGRKRYEVADIERINKELEYLDICLLYTSTRGLSLNFLQDSIRYLIQADYQIKTGVYEKGYLFEKALLQIASQSN